MNKKPDSIKIIEENPHIDKGQLGKVLNTLAKLKELGIKPTESPPPVPYQRTIFNKAKKD